MASSATTAAITLEKIARTEPGPAPMNRAVSLGEHGDEARLAGAIAPRAGVLLDEPAASR